MIVAVGQRMREEADGWKRENTLLRSRFCIQIWPKILSATIRGILFLMLAMAVEKKLLAASYNRLYRVQSDAVRKYLIFCMGDPGPAFGT